MSRSYALSPEQQAAALNAITMGEVTSLRALAQKIGGKREAIRTFLRPIIEALERGGALQACPCGRPAFHPRGCAERCLPASRPEVVRALVNGEPAAVIADRVGLAVSTIKSVARNRLTADQKRQRQKAINLRRARLAPVRPDTDPLYARISAAIGRGIPAALRDDIISEVYLAVLEGLLATDRIERDARRFVNAGFAAWASKFGTLSLDVAVSTSGVGDRTWLEALPDPAALTAFDRIFEQEAA